MKVNFVTVLAAAAILVALLLFTSSLRLIPYEETKTNTDLSDIPSVHDILLLLESCQKNAFKLESQVESLKAVANTNVIRDNPIPNINSHSGEIKEVDALRKEVKRLTNKIDLNTPHYPFLWHVQQVQCKSFKTFGNMWNDHSLCLDMFVPTQSTVVYSFGIGEDYSFDKEIIGEYGLTVYAFDPSPAARAYMERERLAGRWPQNFHFYPWGIWYFDGLLPMAKKDATQHSIVNVNNNLKAYDYFEVYTLSTIMKKLKHSTVDILKIDVEGSEWQIFDHLLQPAESESEEERHNAIPCKHILTEFHHPDYDQRYGKGAVANSVNIIIQKLNALGFFTFDVGLLREDFQYRDMGFTRVLPGISPNITSGPHIYDSV